MNYDYKLDPTYSWETDHAYCSYEHCGEPGELAYMNECKNWCGHDVYFHSGYCFKMHMKKEHGFTQEVNNE